MKPRRILWRYKAKAPCPFMDGFVTGESATMVQINHDEKLWSHHDPIWVKKDEIEMEPHPCEMEPHPCEMEPHPWDVGEGSLDVVERVTESELQEVTGWFIPDSVCGRALRELASLRSRSTDGGRG